MYIPQQSAEIFLCSGRIKAYIGSIPIPIPIRFQVYKASYGQLLTAESFLLSFLTMIYIHFIRMDKQKKSFPMSGICPNGMV